MCGGKNFCNASISVCGASWTIALYGGRRGCTARSGVYRRQGQIVHGGVTHAVGKGDVFILPAEIGVCALQPRGGVTLLEIAIPEPEP